LVDRSDFFKTGNLVGWNGEGTDWYSNLQGKKIYGRFAVVSVRIDGFRELLEQLTLKTVKVLDILNLARKDSVLVTLAQ
jgi:hypothetical protein